MRKRGARHGVTSMAEFSGDEQWFRYLCEEFLPRLHQIHSETDGVSYEGRVMLAGMSMGGYHCVNLYLRRPDLFGGCLSLSGLFHAGYFFPNYDDVDIYYNSPVDYLPQMPQDHPLVEQFRHGKIIICCGQGAWEDEAKKDAWILKEQFERLAVPAWIDFWGEDVNQRLALVGEAVSVFRGEASGGLRETVVEKRSL